MESVFAAFDLLAQKRFPAGPGVGASLFIGVVGVGSFTGTHEAVARAIVGYRIVGFAGGFHGGDSIGNGRINARVIAGVEAVDGSFDARHGVFFWWAAVKHER